MLAGDHVVMQAVWSKALKACYHVGTGARKLRWHVSTLTLKAKAWWHVRHVSTQGTLEREHESMQSTFVFEHVSKTRFQVSTKARKAR